MLGSLKDRQPQIARIRELYAGELTWIDSWIGRLLNRLDDLGLAENTVVRLVDQLGAGPFFLIEGVPLENVLSRGEPAVFVHNSAFGSCGGGAIELIEAVSLAPKRVEER